MCGLGELAACKLNTIVELQLWTPGFLLWPCCCWALSWCWAVAWSLPLCWRSAATPACRIVRSAIVRRSPVSSVVPTAGSVSNDSLICDWSIEDQGHERRFRLR